MSIRHLRIRIKELATEAKHIRHEERQTSGMEKWHLLHHRRHSVGHAARHYLLAYGFMRGMAYLRMEPKVRENNNPNWALVERHVKKFGGDPAELERWRCAPLAEKDQAA